MASDECMHPSRSLCCQYRRPLTAGAHCVSAKAGPDDAGAWLSREDSIGVSFKRIITIVPCDDELYAFSASRPGGNSLSWTDVAPDGGTWYRPSRPDPPHACAWFLIRMTAIASLGYLLGVQHADAGMPAAKLGRHKAWFVRSHDTFPEPDACAGMLTACGSQHASCKRTCTLIQRHACVRST